MRYAIQTHQLTKQYPQTQTWKNLFKRRALENPAVNQVSLAIPEGEIFGLVGPNGAGKTTLVKMLSTLVTPTSGSAVVNGYLLSQERSIKASLGLVTSDERSFYWRLSGRENLRFFAALHGMPRANISQRVDETLTLVELTEKARRPFRTYSTGMRQRLSIARSLLHRPQLLFLDEPTKGLDPSVTRRLHELIRNTLTQQEGITVFLTTHRLDEAETLCDRVAIMNKGQIAACGTLEQLQAEFGEDSLRGIFSAVMESPAPAPGPGPTIPPPPEQLPAPEAATPSRQPLPPAERPAPGTPSPLAKAMAFLRRDFKSQLTYRLSFFFQFFRVFFSIAVFYFISQMLGPAAIPQLQAYGGDYFAFVLIGIALAEYFGVGLSAFSRSLRKAQTTGTLEAMLSTPTRLSTVVISSSLWSYFLTTFRVLVYLGVGGLFLGVDLSGSNLVAAVLILLLTIISFSSLGILSASFIIVLKQGDPITWVVGAISSLLGGIYYPVEILPRWLQTFSALLPVTYSLRGMRLALLEDAGLGALKLDLLALLGFCVALLPLSLAAFRYAVGKAKMDGSLTHY
ncbi:MAG: ABC transporter ATP-binding protein NatA [Chloroflexi bacterium]|nr:ABC transporter ATP-binding protein NatA [Chloroflexota bacterium]